MKLIFTRQVLQSVSFWKWGDVYMRKLAPARVSYRLDFFISFTILPLAYCRMDVHEAVQQMNCGWQSSHQLEECIGNHPPQERRHTWYQLLEADQPLTSSVQRVFTNPTSKNAKHFGATSTKKASRLQSGFSTTDHIQVVHQLQEKAN